MREMEDITIVLLMSLKAKRKPPLFNEWTSSPANSAILSYMLLLVVVFLMQKCMDTMCAKLFLRNV